METTTRNADLASLAEMLTNARARSLDVVASASAIRSERGDLVISGTEPILTDDGVTSADGRYRPTAVAEEGLAAKLNVPLAYLRRMRADRPDLFDANVNGWLHGERGLVPREDGHGHELGQVSDPDSRSFLVRCFRPDDDGTPGIARAFLSQNYRVIDNLDVLTAALDGVRASGVEVEVVGADLTDRRMYVRIASPAVQALAPTLLARYRSPFSGALGSDNPTVFAGFVLSNSETGCGAFTITPRLTVEVCSNGMTITKDALRSIHLGSRMDEGVVRWSEETQAKNLELVTSQARDAVATFLDLGYVERAIASIEETAAKPLTNPAETVKVVAQRLRYGETEAAGILDHFIRGGDTTAGGILHAVTAYAQVVPDADEAAELEDSALRAMEVAAAV